MSILIKVKLIWLRFCMSWFLSLFELVYLSRESFDVITVTTILKRFCVDRIVSPVVGKTQHLSVICWIALLFELDMKRFFKTVWFCLPNYNRNRVWLFLYSVIEIWFYWIANNITFSNEMICYWLLIQFDFIEKIWFDFDSDSVYYFRLATKSDDSVAKSVELDFYCFSNKISF